MELYEHGKYWPFYTRKRVEYSRRSSISCCRYIIFSPQACFVIHLRWWLWTCSDASIVFFIKYRLHIAYKIWRGMIIVVCTECLYLETWQLGAELSLLSWERSFWPGLDPSCPSLSFPHVLCELFQLIFMGNYLAYVSLLFLFHLRGLSALFVLLVQQSLSAFKHFYLFPLFASWSSVKMSSFTISCSMMIYFIILLPSFFF